MSAEKTITKTRTDIGDNLYKPSCIVQMIKIPNKDPKNAEQLPMPVPQPSDEVSPQVTINKKMSLVQRKAWNVLVVNSYSGLEKEETHEIDMNLLMRELRYNDIEELKKSLLSMMSITVELNYLKTRDKNQWGATNLLADAQINNNILSYSFSPLMRSKLLAPELYAKINLSIQKTINSKAALILYELAKDHYIAAKGEGQTPYIEVEKLKRLLETSSQNSYEQFKEFNRTILKRAIAEVNKKTDITITVEPKIERRTCVAVKFRIAGKTNKASMVENLLTKNKQSELPISGSEIYNLLIKEHKLSPAQAKDIVSTRKEDFIREQITYVTKYTSSPDFQGNHAAYLFSALKNGYYEPPPPKEKLPEIEPGMKIRIHTGEIFIVTPEKTLQTGAKESMTEGMIRQGLANKVYEVCEE